MLNIELKDPESGLEFDVDNQLALVDVPINELKKLLIKEIDQGEYIGDRAFIDRFGYKMHIDNLSTGCKAALLVANTNKIVDLQECGYNAISAIVRNCKSGNIVLMDQGITIAYSGDDRYIPIDVAIDGYHVKDLHTLNNYLKYAVDLSEEEYNAEKIDE